jgi:hypothetical protein
MFSIFNQSKTSLPDMTADINQHFSIDISKEALHKKFKFEAVTFLKELVKRQISKQFCLSVGDELKTKFTAINVKDSSKFSTPDTFDGQYPGFGNFSKKNGLMNIQYEYDILNGDWQYIQLTNIKRNDQKDSNETVNLLSKGALYIRDLGYITPTYLKAIVSNDAYFLNRLPAQINIYTPEKVQMDWKNIHRKFNKTKAEILDIDVLIYKKDLIPCRLVIERVSDSVYRKRLKKAENSAKSRGVGLSEIHKIRCRYNTFITNVDKDTIPAKKIRTTYYLRWQIELVFKTWKSFFEIHKVKKVKKERIECQLLAKLLWVILNWRLFNICNAHVQKETPTAGVSILTFFKRCHILSQTLRLVILNRLALKTWICKDFLPQIDNTACEAPWGKVTHYQVVNELLKP